MNFSKQDEEKSSLYIHNVLERANQKSYNWFPLVEHLIQGDPPEAVAEMLLDAHFGLSAYVAADEDGAARYEMENALFILRKLYQLFQKMKPEEREIPVYLCTSEGEETGRDTPLPPIFTDSALVSLTEKQTRETESQQTDAEWVIATDTESPKKRRKNAASMYGRKACTSY